MMYLWERQEHVKNWPWTRTRRAYLIALVAGKPLKKTKLIVTAGLKCPPEVDPHIAIAKTIPKVYPKPTWKTADTAV